MASDSPCLRTLIDAELNLTEVLCIYENDKRQIANHTLQIEAAVIDLGSVDYLVLTAFLLLSIGISLTRSLSANSDDNEQDDEDKEENNPEEKPKPTKKKSIFAILATAGSIVSPFVNTLCLFSVNGEVFANDASILAVFLGILCSIFLIYVTNFYSIMRDNNIKSISEYLKKRYQSKISCLMVIAASILRQLIGGVLNLHIVGVVVSSMTKLSSPIIYILVSAAAAICVSVSKIHTRASKSFGGTFIWLLAATIVVTLCLITSNSGGFGALFSRSYAEGKFRVPSFSLLPWERNAIWGFLCIGIFMGIQIYGFSRVALRYAVDLPTETLNRSIAVSLIYILLWMLLGTWCGLCTSVIFQSSTVDAEEVSPRSIDGSLSKMISTEMQNHKGFRGFFIAALLAASISGLARRFNQLIGLIYITFKDCKDLCFTPKINRTYQKQILTSTNIPENVLKQLEWEERQRTCFPVFSFKLTVGGSFAILSLWLAWILHTSNERVWELWATVAGILNGSVLSALFLGLLCPCVPHISIITGLMVGWVIPCCLAIGNRIFIRPGLLYFRDISFLDAVWLRNNEDERSSFELFVERNSFDYFGKMSSQHKVFSTCYGYYGIIGFISCLISALIFTTLIRQWKPAPNLPIGLIHPMVTKNLKISTDSSEPKSPTEGSKSKRRKHRAMSLVQETVGV